MTETNNRWRREKGRKIIRDNNIVYLDKGALSDMKGNNNVTIKSNFLSPLGTNLILDSMEGKKAVCYRVECCFGLAVTLFLKRFHSLEAHVGPSPSNLFGSST